jgi:hypothetical protein
MLVAPMTVCAQPAQAKLKVPPRERTVIRLPSYEQVKSDPVLYAHANRVLHLETNPGNARALVQAHGEANTARDVWINPPPIPLTTPRWTTCSTCLCAQPAPALCRRKRRHDGATKIPAWEMIRFRQHHARLLRRLHLLLDHRARRPHHPEPQEDSILREIEDIRDKVRASPASSPTWAAPRPTCTAWAARAPRSRPPAASPAASTPASART